MNKDSGSCSRQITGETQFMNPHKHHQIMMD